MGSGLSPSTIFLLHCLICLPPFRMSEQVRLLPLLFQTAETHPWLQKCFGFGFKETKKLSFWRLSSVGLDQNWPHRGNDSHSECCVCKHVGFMMCNLCVQCTDRVCMLHKHVLNIHYMHTHTLCMLGLFIYVHTYIRWVYKQWTQMYTW